MHIIYNNIVRATCTYALQNKKSQITSPRAPYTSHRLMSVNTQLAAAN